LIRRFDGRVRPVVEPSSPAKLALQAAVALAATLPVVAGAFDVLLGIQGADAWAVNHERYLSGLLLGIGIGFWSTLPDIETKSARFRLLSFIVAIGGLCRLLGVALGDPASPAVLAALFMELVVTPALCFWQGRLLRPPRHKSWAVPFSPQLDS
jgi:hypothetical protein